ncbi:MAG: 5'-nucleotidase, lipoprotein e(P4) family [Chitinophagaceae bacterium]|nr:5'-nucleotidase, lipoprotein e(P4) family [Chitinophagaceae bacterium]
MKKIFIYLFIIGLAACSTQQKLVATAPENNMIPSGKLFTTFFQQRAAEYKALCFQAYNIAAWRLDQSLQTPSSKPKAIVTDIDETVLDNSAYAVHQGLLGKDYDIATWAEWTALAQADTLAGALTFFNYAASKNVEVFYITNREEKERESTLRNLNKFGFPFADEKHLITKSGTSSKEARRQSVLATHEIVLLLGDNLADFSLLFDKKTEAERLQNVQKNAAAFGEKFIMLPNANYGDWESALYQYNYKLSLQQKDSVVRGVLKSY